MTAPDPIPALPEPGRTRWQPLRVGLVDLYLYDAEEFHFHDGRLLLRGNNGTGKSKVLSLTLPFLLDARLTPARVEPDGDRGKRMEWNLLLGRHPQRTGYTWLELGRRDERDGRVHYLTLGCGLRAVAGRARVDSWYFLTDRRIGQDLWLASAERVVLDRERLIEAVGARGQVFSTGQAYRRAVDERLFGLGAARYDALIDTLIVLRQPQLSKKPDESSLSTALTNALPVLPRTVVEDVAQALDQLEDYREELAAIERLRDAVARFGRRYHAYARVQARRQARVLRRAQTRFDNASRATAAAGAERAAAAVEVQASEQRRDALDLALVRARATQAALQRDPVMGDAQRLRETERDAAAREQETARARTRRAAADARERAEVSELAERAAVLERAGEGRVRAEAAAADAASAAGVVQGHRGATARLADEPAAVPGMLDLLVEELVQVAERRREQIRNVELRLRERGAALQAYERARDRYRDRVDALEAASARRDDRVQALARACESLVAAWAGYLAAVRIVRLPDSDALVDAVGQWAETLAGPNPARVAVDRAQRLAAAQLAASRAAQTAAHRVLEEEDHTLAGEAERLSAGEDRGPVPAPSRDPAGREARPGAPLWQLVDFADGVAGEHRAGLEAALEGAGLLDAWLAPDGVLLRPGTDDAWLEPRADEARSLACWLEPAGEDPAVDPATVRAVLAGIACTEEEPADAEAWVAPSGQYRIGPLAGAWRKHAAEHIGHAARAAARRRRLAAIAERRAELAAALRASAAELDALAARERMLAAELDALPEEEALRDAHAALSAVEAECRMAAEQVREAEQARESASRAVAAARAVLARDAADLELPADGAALGAVDHATRRYEVAGAELVARLRAHVSADAEHARQETRARAARDETAERERELLDGRRETAAAVARRDLMRETVGAAVAELERRLATMDEKVIDTERAARAELERVTAAREERARAEQRLHDAEARQEECTRGRLEAVAALRSFTRTGLLEVALPAIPVPAPDAVWAVAPALELARAAEQALVDVAAEDVDWERVQSRVSEDYTALGQALSTQGHRAEAETTDYGLVVRIVHQGRPERPDILERRLDEELGQRRAILTAREREVIENHLVADVGASLQRLLQEADRRVRDVNEELALRATGTGVRFRLRWLTRAEGEDGSPAGLAAARGRLLDRSADAWSAADRALVGDFLQTIISAERPGDGAEPLVEHLERALDYRRWHEFRVERHQDGTWRRLAGPASSGERALGLTVPLFAAASSHYASAGSPHAPRLVLLDEAFAGIDDQSRAQCMALIREFDLDLVMTSEREWGCYAELPGVAICHLLRREGIDAVHVSRWTWDGHERIERPDPRRRFPQAEEA